MPQPKDPYYHTPVRETKRGFFIRKPPKGGSPISIIINEGEFSSVEKHHMIRIQEKKQSQSHSQSQRQGKLTTHTHTHRMSTDTDTEETQTLPSSVSDDDRLTRSELQKQVEQIHMQQHLRNIHTTSMIRQDDDDHDPTVSGGDGSQPSNRATTSTTTDTDTDTGPTKKMVTKSKLKSGSSSTVPTVYQGVTLETLSRVSSSISTSLRRTYSRTTTRSRSLSRGRSSTRSLASKEEEDNEEHDDDNHRHSTTSTNDAERRKGTVLRRVRSFSLNAKDKIRSRSRSIARALELKRNRNNRKQKEQMVFVQQSYEEDPLSSTRSILKKSMANSTTKTTHSTSSFSNDRRFLGFFCGGLDAFCGTHDDDDHGEFEDQNSIRF